VGFSEKRNSKKNSKRQADNQDRRYNKTDQSLPDPREKKVKAENSENIDFGEIYRDA